MIRRKLENIIINRFNKGKVIILLGPRQVGKTTLSRQIAGFSKTFLSAYPGSATMLVTLENYMEFISPEAS